MRAWLGVCAGVGLAASGAALYTHARLVAQPGSVSVCDVSTTMSGSQVYLSRFGSVAGVPVALGGLVWFGLVALLVAGARRGPPAFHENVPTHLFVLSTVGLAVILYLAYATFFVLGTICLFCLATCAAVVGIAALSAKARSQPLGGRPRRLAADLRTLTASPGTLALAASFLAVSVAAAVAFPRDSAVAAAASQALPPVTDAQRAQFEQWLAAQPHTNLPVDAGGAKVLVVKFTDYQCPACAKTYLDYKPVLAKYAATHPAEVKFVELDYPINPACNPSVQVTLHAAACEAAVAVRLARERGKGEEMETWIAVNNPTLTAESIKEAARTIGGVTNFDARYASVIEAVKTDGALGGLNQVRGTPTFFINGTMVYPPVPPQFFDLAIALALDKAGK